MEDHDSGISDSEEAILIEPVDLPIFDNNNIGRASRAIEVAFDYLKRTAEYYKDRKKLYKIKFYIVSSLCLILACLFLIYLMTEIVFYTSRRQPH